MAGADIDETSALVRQLEVAAPLVFGAATFIFFALCSPPSFYWLDSAELSAAGIGLGSSHPTGFPLYMMLVKAASLVPIGELAFRVNLLSAACAALCVGLVARLVIVVGRGGARSIVGAWLAGLTLASSLLFARHAAIAEVYVPTAAMLAATFLALDHTARATRGGGGGARAGLMLAVLCGLGLGLHSSFRFLVPIPVAVILWRRLRRGARWPLYAPALALGIGLALQLYIPVRSATGRVGALDWGHPRTLSATWDHLSGARIRDAYASEIASSTPEVVSVNIAELAAAVFDGLGPVVPLLALFGAGWLLWRRRSRALGAALVIAGGLDIIYSFWINPMGQVDGQNATTLALVACIAAGLGAVRFLARMGRATVPVGVVLAVLAAAMPLMISGSELLGRAGDETPRRLSDAGLGQMPPRGIALTESDSLSAGLLFLTTVEGARPDAAVLVRQHLRDLERVAMVIGRSRDLTVLIAGDGASAALSAIIGTGRPLFWEVGTDGLPPGMRVTAAVPMAVLTKGESGPPPAGDIEASVVRLQRLWSEHDGDPLATRMLATHIAALGRLAFIRAQLGKAGQLFETALAVRPEHTVALINLGVVHSRRGDLPRALELTRKALTLEPNRVAALINAGRYARELGELDAARRYARRAVALAPTNKSAVELASSLGL